MAGRRVRDSIVDNEKYRRFEHVIGLYIYYISRKMEWARKQVDRPEATSQVLNEAIDEIAARLADLKIAVVAEQDARSNTVANDVSTSAPDIREASD